MDSDALFPTTLRHFKPYSSTGQPQSSLPWSKPWRSAAEWQQHHSEGTTKAVVGRKWRLEDEQRPPIEQSDGWRSHPDARGPVTVLALPTVPTPTSGGVIGREGLQRKRRVLPNGRRTRIGTGVAASLSEER